MSTASIAYEFVIGNTYKDHSEALRLIAKEHSGIKPQEWKQVGRHDFESNAFHPKSFAGYPYTLHLTLDINSQGKSLVISANLMRSQSLSRKAISDGHIKVFSYQRGLYSVFGYGFSVTRPIIRTTGFRGQKGLNDKVFHVAFKQGRTDVFTLYIDKAHQCREDEVAQLTVNALIADRLNHEEYKAKTQLTYLTMIQERYNVKTIQEAIDKMKSLENATNFELPEFIIKNKSFKDSFVEVDEYKTEEALNSLYPIIKKGYNRGSQIIFQG
jgi:hypothetical protein